MMIPKLMSLNCVNFDFMQCNFSDEKLNIKDASGDSRENSGRAAIFRATECPLTYTFEVNYATGMRSNTLCSRYDMLQDKKIIIEDPLCDTNSAIYRMSKSPIFTVEIFFDCG